MERKSETREIGGRKYTVRQMGAVKGSRLLVKIMKVMGAGDAKSVIAALDDALFVEVMNELAPWTEVEIESNRVVRLSDVLDAHFAGNYADLTEWLIFAVEVNFADFFRSLPRLLGASGGPAAPKAPA
jgi:hypothetical protein